ncbi:MAG: ketopantoate reductase family protein [Hyphomicrobiaceae bacterium]
MPRSVRDRDCDVTFLVRQERKVQLLTTGLMLASPFGFRRPVTALTPEELVGAYDAVIVATRAQDYRAALTLVEPAIGPDTAAISIVEGADHLRAGSKRRSLHRRSV